MKSVQNAVIWVFMFFAVSPALLFAQQFHFDRRTQYDVKKYTLRLKIDPGKEFISGTVGVEGIGVNSRLDSLVLDLADGFSVSRISDGFTDSTLNFRYSKNQLVVGLKNGLKKGEKFFIRIAYSGVPPKGKGGMGPRAVIFTQTPSGTPWVGTSCQTMGAHYWWPCKAAFFHPEDKADSVSIQLTVPDTLFAVSNGRFLGTVPDSAGWKTYRWLMTYPASTYLITMYIGPYVELTQPIPIPAEKDTLLAHYYILSGNEARARKEFFPRVPDELNLYTKYYGPFAFAKDKFALVQSSYPGMENTTAVAVGPAFPHTLLPGETNPLQWYDRQFNYMVVHEAAHEWWGNAVTALTWGDFWLHEGFATYSEALWMEHRFGEEPMHQYMAKMSFKVDSTTSVYQPRHKTAREAYHLNIYWKGAWVLHTLRYVMGDEAFFKTLREFNTDPRYRYHNAATADFQAACEKNYGKDLSWFFLEWIYGTGWPEIHFESQVSGKKVTIQVSNVSTSRTRFKIPLDVVLHSRAGAEKRRLWLKPGQNRFKLTAKYPVTSVDPVGLRWILSRKKHGTMWYFTDLDFVMGKFGKGLELTPERKLFVKEKEASYISPVRYLFRGAKFVRLRLDTSKDARWKKVALEARAHFFRKKNQKPWEKVNPDSLLPGNLQHARSIEYRLDFSRLTGETLPIPKVILTYE
ncbi:aminopeptidase N [bacterium BMS3Bbin03]|nr:aminopeptidase N [bacterium BMS3Bbin03]